MEAVVDAPSEGSSSEVVPDEFDEVGSNLRSRRIHAWGSLAKRARRPLTVNFRQPRVLVIHWFQL
jgi:hypothetical protein